ncbi:MAG TPA: beta-propeller fold lactonase family protein [Verrucomicrobiae bacterium]
MRVKTLVMLSVGLIAGTGCAPNRSGGGGPPGTAAVGGKPEVSWPGNKPDGSVLLPNQWSLRPAGREVDLGDFPVNIAVHPAGRFAAVLHAGYGAHQIMVIDVTTAAVVSRTGLNEAFYGLEFSPDGKRVFCSGAGNEVVHSFEFRDGSLTNHQTIRLRDAKECGVPAGLALDKAGRTLWAANVRGHRVSKVELGAEPRVSDFLLGTNGTGASPGPIIPSPDFDTAAADKRAEALLYAASATEPYPYACRVDESRQRLYVSLWAQAAVAVMDLKSGQILARWPTQEHPCEMMLTRNGRFLFIANAARNTVSVYDTDAGKGVETIWAALYPDSQPGSTPNSLALSPDDQTLFVANADNNLLAVFDVRTPGKSRSLGFIPVGWYPTSVRVTPDGKRLLVANGKGVRPMANPQGPQPAPVPKDAANRTVQYIAGLLRGTLSIIDLPARKELERQLAAYTAQAYQCSPLRRGGEVGARWPAGNPIPPRVGDPSPIKYCLYIIKENRTYDQVVGDMREGNGDPTLCLFPERVTPNLHKIARDFVLLDNFYVESEVSADGHEWSMGAYATDFVEKSWPLSYGHNSSGKFPYPSEGNFPVAYPAGGYLWDKARQAGVSYRSYGEFVANPIRPNQPARTKMKTLEGHFDPWYQGFDLGYPDQKRADRFISELKNFEAEGEMPRLQILRLPNDHTHGTTPGMPTPTAYVGDNDLALGRIVEAVSHSKFWAQTAIFVVEDDAQNGPDHVDAHRTTAFVVSPYTKRRFVDSSMYSTASMLRTMELILGLQPMSQFDAAARPMYNSFQAAADLRPYQALPAHVSLEEKNQREAWGGNIKMNFAREDAADDLLLNEVVWRSVRGADSPMPAPVRAAFVFPEPKEKDGD